MSPCARNSAKALAEEFSSSVAVKEVSFTWILSFITAAPLFVSLEEVLPDRDEFLAAVGDDDAASELQAETSKKIAMNVKSFFIRFRGNILSTNNIPKAASNNKYLFIIACYAFLA